MSTLDRIALHFTFAKVRESQSKTTKHAVRNWKAAEAALPPPESPRPQSEGEER